MKYRKEKKSCHFIFHCWCCGWVKGTGNGAKSSVSWDGTAIWLAHQMHRSAVLRVSQHGVSSDPGKEAGGTESNYSALWHVAIKPPGSSILNSHTI